jgi:S1-C subfamily serine protease
MNKGRTILTPALLTAAVVILGSCERNSAAAPGDGRQGTIADAPPANQLEAQVESVYTRASASVVQVTSLSVSYNFFLQPVPQQGTGSGFVYDREGHIVTNYHVVENASSVKVGLQDGKTYDAKVVGSDPSTDLAVLQIRPPSLPEPLVVARPESVRVGQFVIALGNPFGLTSTLTFGVVSALGRVIQSPNGRFIGEAIQTDAPINPGNSGGPLLNLNAEVIGVDSQIISPSGVSAGIGFAVSSATIMRVVPALIAHGSYPHPWLGISGLDLSPEAASALKAAGVTVPDSGLLVVSAPPGGPAAKAGIRGGSRVLDMGGSQVPVGGDVITAVNGKPVSGISGLTVYLEDNTRVGQSVPLEIVRDGRRLTVDVTLGTRPASVR